MVQGIHERATATHRESCNGPVSFVCTDPVSFFHVGHQLLKEEILVIPVSLRAVKITPLTGIAIGHNDNHGSAFPLQDRFVCNILHLSKLNPPTLVVPGTVQQIQNRIAALGGFIVGGQVNGIFPLHLQDLARHGEVVENLSSRLGE